MAVTGVVTVLSVDPAEEHQEFSAEMFEHLQRHGLHPTFETLPSGLMSVAETLLLRTKQVGADMVVMGAYGRSRLRENVLGGVTHDMLRDMTRPLLMSH